MTETKNTIIFDFDGTLADTFNLAIEVMNGLMKDYKLPGLLEKDVEYFRGLPARDVKKELDISTLRLIWMLIKGQKRLHARIDEVSLFRGSFDIIDKLKSSGYKLGIITSNTKENVESVLTRYDLLEYFDFVYPSKLVFAKHLTIKKAIKKQKLSKNKTVYIGDEVRDYKASKKAGVDCMLVDWGYNNRTILEKYSPDMVFSSFNSLLKRIREKFA